MRKEDFSFARLFFRQTNKERFPYRVVFRDEVAFRLNGKANRHEPANMVIRECAGRIVEHAKAIRSNVFRAVSKMESNTDHFSSIGTQ